MATLKDGNDYALFDAYAKRRAELGYPLIDDGDPKLTWRERAIIRKYAKGVKDGKEEAG
jgi:hypothetical protein